ncbi:MAG: tRNA epoxyqueuosine(34) reductase QueG [Bacteroidales bacterium]|nr:tRNA epoxyqueuosine(34) reductase QueG [Bacteroidales bacterium]MCF8390677.1 tRNA epoxyqueuosine(34) reductase QueG [Bacteroidales bacterium]
MKTIAENTALIKKKALELGFSDCGFSKAGFLSEDAVILDKWLQSGHHADLQWMENNLEKRKDPRELVQNAKSVISVLLNYYNPEMQEDSDAPVISRYAYGRDYHKVMKKKLKALFSFINEIFPEATGRAFVDSAPVMEHALARNAGLGWIGKNSLLLTKNFGSYVFIGEIIIDQELVYNENISKDFCGTCSLCISECPTKAINANRTVDAGKCISYLTIEHKGDIPSEFKNSFYNRAFGCDICQDVCPWNRDLIKHNNPAFEPKEDLLKKTKDEWHCLEEEEFDYLFEGSAVKRTKFEGLRRNIDFLNSGD